MSVREKTDKRITVIAGDGIGPSIIESALKVLEVLDCGLEYDFAEAGLSSLEKNGELLPQKTLDLVAQNKFLLKGPLTTPSGKGFTSINVSLRKKFDLYANVRPVISYPNTKSRYEGVNIITIRENT
jgi:isocitrate dehydrogenase (NAD+)